MTPETRSGFTIRYGPALWQIQETNHPLVDGVLWEEDVIMLLGSEKAGKSILGMQLAYNLTSGEAFLDKYPITAPIPVLYLQTEGKPAEMLDRMKAMREAVAIDDLKFYHLFKRFFPLDQRESIDALNRAISKLPVPPKVIIVDSLYTSMMGDLIDNADVRRLLEHLSGLIDKWHCALVLIHHETKEQRESGQIVERGDKGSYGSIFLRAWSGHILYLKKHANKLRTLTCDTQRSGKVLEKEDLIMIEPHPLLFQIAEDLTPSIAKVMTHIPPTGISREDLIKTTGLSSASVDKAVRQLCTLHRICKSHTKPVIYSLPNGLQENGQSDNLVTL